MFMLVFTRREILLEGKKKSNYVGENNMADAQTGTASIEI